MEKEGAIVVIMKLILKKLINMGKWGGAHTELRNVTKGLPSRYLMTPKGKKLVQTAIKELINLQFLIAKPSTGEIHVSLNPHKAKEIRGFLKS